ncbi:unnamed protein product, partial [Adineta steineri]
INIEQICSVVKVF